MSKQEPAALMAPFWFPTCCCEGIAVASCSADKMRAVCGGSWIFFSLELFLLQKRAENSPAQQMFQETCATADNSRSRFLKMLPKWGPCIYLGRFLCFVFSSFPCQLCKPNCLGFVFPCFSDESFWVGSQSGMIQPPTHPEFPPLSALVTR